MVMTLYMFSVKTADKRTWARVTGGGEMAQEVRSAVWQSEGRRFDPRFNPHPGRVEVSLSKTPNPQLLLTSWSVPCMAANRRWCVNVCVNG